MLLLALTVAYPQLYAQKGNKILSDIKQQTTFGGYVVGRAAFNDQDLDAKNTSHSAFDLRLVRAYVKGKVWNISYQLQMEMSGVGGTSSATGPRVLDAWAEWKQVDWMAVKFGQFKRSFTFENPMNPWDIGFGSFSQSTVRLAGMTDRVGEHSSGGRDLGIQIQGDLIKCPSSQRYWLHYQLGVFNGQGINHSEQNNAKDLIGGIWVSPAKNLQIGVFGWSGSYCSTVGSRKVSVDRNRMAYGVKYESDWSVRAEYISSQGHKVSDYTDNGDGTLTVKGNDHADAWYVLLGAPLTKRCKLYGKWDVYRDQKNNGTKKSIYTLSANYYLYKNLKLQALYGFVEDNSTTSDKHYNTYELQLYWRF